MYKTVVFVSGLTLIMTTYGTEQKKAAEATKELMDGAERNDLLHVKQAIAHGAKIDAINSHGDTALHLASLSTADSSALIDVLLGNNADIEAKDKNGDTPLAVANNEGALVALVKHGANIDALNNRGETPAILAVRTGTIWKLKLLVNHGADIFIADKVGDTIFTKKVHLRSPVQTELLQKKLDRYLSELKKEIHKAAKSPKPLTEQENKALESQTSQEQAQNIMLPMQARGIPENIAGYVVGDLTPQERAELKAEMEQEALPCAPGGPETRK